MKVIVTGSEGFVGRSLCQRLRERGCEVLRIDRVLGSDAASLSPLLAGGGIGCVYHLAAAINDDIGQNLSDNIATFVKVCHACRTYKVKLVYASSPTAYSPNTTSMYGISKAFAEKFAQIYCPTSTGCRIHSAYGPHPRPGTLLWHLMNDAAVTLWNLGRNTRCFTYIDDVVDGLLFACNSSKPLVNIVNEENTTTYQFACEVSRFKEVRINFLSSMRQYDAQAYKIDTSVPTIPLRYKKVRDGIEAIMKQT